MSSKTSDKIGLTFSVKLSVLYALFFVISSIGLFLVTYYLIHDLVEQREREIISSRIDEYAPGMKKEVFAPSRRALTSNPLQQEIVILSV